MKQRFFSFGIGLLILAAVFSLAMIAPFSSVIAFVCNDARLFYLLGAILIFAGALWLGRKSNPSAWNALLLFAPLAAAFAFTTLRDLPFMWPSLVFWLGSAVVGLRIISSSRGERLWVFGGAGLLLLGSLWYCGSYVPKQVGALMSRPRNQTGPAFLFQPVTGGKSPLSATPGKVLVIDFAQTWCPPCLVELPQIAIVHEDLKDRKDIEFVVVATDAKGDTPQRFRSFVEQQHIKLPIAFDAGSKAYTAFGVHGFPSVVVLDKSGRVRFTHEGYNSAEINFRSDLEQLLRTL
ncbi:MAG: TlpA family protein disulfide reductase [Chthoniobacterales bacterium]